MNRPNVVYVCTLCGHETADKAIAAEHIKPHMGEPAEKKRKKGVKRGSK